MKKIAVVFCVFFSLSMAVAAQTSRRTVTNFDLEKYRDQRVAAEREYRDTYAQRGMLSPDEIKAASDARIQQTLDLAERMRSDQIEQQRLALQAQAQQIEIEELRSQQPAPQSAFYPYDSSIWSYGVFSDFGGGFRGRNFRVGTGRDYYVGGGNVWPGRLGTRPQPLRPTFRTGSPHHRH
jgi:hypothetical protein